MRCAMKRLAFLALAVLVVAACGGSKGMSKSDYEQKLQTDGKAVQAAVTALTSGATVTTLAQLATKVDTAEASVKQAADDLEKVTPPQDAVADNTAIVKALRAIQAGLENVKRTATSGDAAAVQKAAAKIESSPQLQAAEKAIADLKSKGYKVGIFGS